MHTKPKYTSSSIAPMLNQFIGFRSMPVLISQFIGSPVLEDEFADAGITKPQNRRDDPNGNNVGNGDIHIGAFH